MTLKELSLKLRKAADMLDDLVGINLNLPTKNETTKTAKEIVKKLRKNPWKNRAYKSKMLKHMAKMRAAKRSKK